MDNRDEPSAGDKQLMSKGDGACSNCGIVGFMDSIVDKSIKTLTKGKLPLVNPVTDSKENEKKRFQPGTSQWRPWSL